MKEASTFWAYTKLISEKMNYSSKGAVNKYDITTVKKKMHTLNIFFEETILLDALEYLNYRADLLNHTIKNLFMDVDTARQEFQMAYKLKEQNQYTCDLPFNKQKNEKKDFAFFTGIINILTEKTLREHATYKGLTYGQDITFDCDPRKLTYLTDNNNCPQAILSRRFDGALPEIRNPIAVWEIKEYYYTTTFGSRIADGVYETLLDGFEINQIEKHTGRKIYHIYFIDDYNVWWNDGKSYLCRIIDMLHSGFVDEVIFGREVLTRWPELLREICLAYYK